MGFKNHGADFLMPAAKTKPTAGPRLKDNEDPPSKEDIAEVLVKYGAKGSALATSTAKLDDALEKLASCGLSGPGFVTMVHSQCERVYFPSNRSYRNLLREDVVEVIRAMFSVPGAFLK